MPRSRSPSAAPTTSRRPPSGSASRRRRTRQLRGLRLMGLIAPPASAGVLARIRGIVLVILLIILVLAIGIRDRQPRGAAVRRRLAGPQHLLRLRPRRDRARRARVLRTPTPALPPGGALGADRRRPPSGSPRAVCGRYTLAASNPAEVRARFRIAEEIEVRRRYNVAPGDEVLAVTTDKEGHARGDLLRWGLVPSWADSPDLGLKMINARAETVAEKPAYRGAFERFRCLIVADGFYEWQKRTRTPRRAGRRSSRSTSPAATGRCSPSRACGRSGTRPTASRLRTCSIITTAANSALASLHDRMPVILEPAKRVGVARARHAARRGCTSCSRRSPRPRRRSVPCRSRSTTPATTGPSASSRPRRIPRPRCSEIRRAARLRTASWPRARARAGDRTGSRRNRATAGRPTHLHVALRGLLGGAVGDPGAEPVHDRARRDLAQQRSAAATGAGVGCVEAVGGAGVEAQCIPAIGLPREAPGRPRLATPACAVAGASSASITSAHSDARMPPWPVVPLTDAACERRRWVHRTRDHRVLRRARDNHRRRAPLPPSVRLRERDPGSRRLRVPRRRRRSPGRPRRWPRSAGPASICRS